MKMIFTQLTVCAAALLSLTTLSFAQTQTTEKASPKAAVMATKKAPKATKTTKTTKVEAVVVSLNKATAKELESLPGIGPAIAERIVAYRTEQGKFSELSELMKVKGIGEKKLAQLRPHLSLD